MFILKLCLVLFGSSRNPSPRPWTKHAFNKHSFQYLYGAAVTTTAWILATPVDDKESHVRPNPAANVALLTRHGSFSLTSRTRYSWESLAWELSVPVNRHTQEIARTLSYWQIMNDVARLPAVIQKLKQSRDAVTATNQLQRFVVAGFVLLAGISPRFYGSSNTPPLRKHRNLAISTFWLHRPCHCTRHMLVIHRKTTDFNSNEWRFER